MNDKTINNLLRRLTRLEEAVFGGESEKLKTGKKIDFSIPIRAFIKKYSKGMSGPKKITLILAYLVQGNLKGSANHDEIKEKWNKMTAKSLLGMKFNPYYSNQAKENDWATTGKHGVYHLRPLWEDILK